MLQDDGRGVAGRAFGPANRTVAASAACLMFGPSTILVFTFGVFIRPLNAAFGWSPPAIVLGATIISLMSVAVSPVQGYLIDRFGSRRVILTFIPLFALGLFAMPFLSGDIRLFYLMCVLLPVLGLGIWANAYLRGVSTWYDRHLGLAVGLANGGIGIGAAVVPVVVTALIAGGHWQRGYVALGLAVLLVTWPIIYFFFHEAPRASVPVGTVGHGAPGDMTFPAIIRTRSFQVLLVAYLAIGFPNVGLIVNQVSLLVDGGVSPARAATAQATLGIAVFVGRFLCGILLDRIPAALLMCVICLGGALACLLYAGGVSGVALVAGPILIGGVVGAEFDVLSYLIKKYFGVASFGRAYGVIFAVFQFAAAIGATALPLVHGRLGSYAPGLYVFAASLLVSAVCFALLRPPVTELRGAGVAAVAS